MNKCLVICLLAHHRLWFEYDLLKLKGIKCIAKMAPKAVCPYVCRVVSCFASPTIIVVLSSRPLPSLSRFGEFSAMYLLFWRLAQKHDINYLLYNCTPMCGDVF